MGDLALSLVAAVALLCLALLCVMTRFAPGVVLRIVLKAYPEGNERVKELLGDWSAIPSEQRARWVTELLELIVREAMPARREERGRKTQRAPGGDAAAAVGRTGAVFVAAMGAFTPQVEDLMAKVLVPMVGPEIWRELSENHWPMLASLAFNLGLGLAMWCATKLIVRCASRDLQSVTAGLKSQASSSRR
ncbi:MAG: hypothetical protein LBC97_07660 [Bifidobacteriaceae bacterium]|jgi:hypothetical protein|nr:hypothetical protein [Bifidobacteriaceae bacterium]